MRGVFAVSTTLVQAGIGAATLLAAGRRDVSAAVNGVVALAAALLGSAIATRAGSGVELPLWVAIAGFLHVVGMLGAYESVDWWDHLTHAVSAALLAALVYAGLLATSPTVGPLSGPALSAGLTLLLVVGLGVFWELGELLARAVGERYGVEPVLVYYGRRDTAMDLVFDVVGVAAVLLADLRVFVAPAERFPRTAELLLAVAGVVAVASLLVAPFADWSHQE